MKVVLKRGDMIEFFNSDNRKDKIKIENILKKGAEDLTEKFATFCNINEISGKAAEYFFVNPKKSFYDYCAFSASVQSLHKIYNS